MDDHISLFYADVIVYLCPDPDYGLANLFSERIDLIKDKTELSARQTD